MAPAAMAAGKHLQKYNEFPRSEASPKLSLLPAQGIDSRERGIRRKTDPRAPARRELAAYRKSIMPDITGLHPPPM